MRVTHLHKGGAGMAAKTACGRNVLRTPLATNWEKFKALPESQQCEKCKTSKQYELNVRIDSK